MRVKCRALRQWNVLAGDQRCQMRQLAHGLQLQVIITCLSYTNTPVQREFFLDLELTAQRLPEHGLWTLTGMIAQHS